MLIRQSSYLCASYIASKSRSGTANDESWFVRELVVSLRLESLHRDIEPLHPLDWLSISWAASNAPNISCKVAPIEPKSGLFNGFWSQHARMSSPQPAGAASSKPSGTSGRQPLWVFWTSSSFLQPCQGGWNETSSNIVIPNAKTSIGCPYLYSTQIRRAKTACDESHSIRWCFWRYFLQDSIAAWK